MTRKLKQAATARVFRLTLVAAWASLWLGADYSKGTPGRDSTIVLENSQVRRVLEKDHPVWRTRSFSRADGSNELLVESDEFQILLMDGTKLDIDDYRADGDPVISKQGRHQVVEIAYVARQGLHPEAPQKIRLEYSLAEEPYLRKSLTLEMKEGQAVDRLQVERFRTRSVCDRGGIGQPIFIDDTWFVGLEYPGGLVEHASGLVTMAHYPGLAKEKDGKWAINSKTAVAGTGLAGDPLELAFHDYLESIRQPAPRHLLANTWIPDETPRGPKGFQTQDYLEYFDLFDRKLAPYGVKLDSLQPDSGKFDPQSVSLPNEKYYPGGYRPLSEQLEARGSTLSLWLCLNGWGNDTEWMMAQGYERANGPFDTFYCISAPKLNAAMRETLKKSIQKGNISYFKHDFVQMMCSLEGHGHLPTYRHGFEANLDATLELLDYERQLKPGILNAPTGYVWLSPWWLMHTNYIYMGVGDYGDIASWPQLYYREWELAFRDGHFFTIYNKYRIPIPISPMITHTFLPYRPLAWIPAPLTIGAEDAAPPREAPAETLREWSDLSAMVFGRGLRLIDVYRDGRKLRPEFWQVLGRFARWHQDHLEILGTTRMIGGNAREGEAYGYVHWKEDRGILCLRNPDIADQAIRVPFDKSVFYRGQEGKAFRGRVVYPYVEDLPDQFTSGVPMLFQIPGYTAMLIELEPGPAREVRPAQPQGLIEGTGSVTPEERDWTNIYRGFPTLKLRATASLQLPDEEMARCDLFLITRSNGALPEFPTLTLNGHPVEVRRAQGAGDAPDEDEDDFTRFRDTDTFRWSIHSIDLREFRGREVELVAISSENPVPFLLEAWVLADRPVKSATVNEENLPPAFWQNYRRQTVRLLSYVLGRVPLHH